MTSILTNIAAMAALQTLRSVDAKMEDTQARVSSGLRVGTASDNAAYWSIATTMRSDNGALSAVQDALGLGAAKVDTAYAAMESTVDVVTEIKNKLVAAREAGVDRAKIQEEIVQLQDQLKSIAESASFSGENWLKAGINGTVNVTTGLIDSDTIVKQVVGSFIRDSNGNVSVKTIEIPLDASTVLFDTSGGNAGILDAEAMIGARKVRNESTGLDEYLITLTTVDDTWTEVNGVWVDDITTPTTYAVKVAGAYVKATGASGAIDFTADAAAADVSYATDVSVSELDITKLSTYATDMQLASEEDVLDYLIQFVDTQLEAMTSATAALGSVSMRIELQEDFVSKLTDSIDSGIGRLVDADMNEESTRLKALQTQQQLGIQSLSIANTASENILTLFRQ
ncbi:flagellin [Pseudorhizobium endolithicum]|uniref:Flagellin n=1 Tax=Pseudorhizobium endolithicum TaxID=1191678 RepID=A0ABM8PYF9_9HYPH|nr:flagellin [Pseudorhizobium endolithicum]CAD7054917.1 flagellin [Pseudorhizobium endolithicum]